MQIGYTEFYNRSHDAVIRVYDEADKRDPDARARGVSFKEWQRFCLLSMGPRAMA